MNLLEYHREFKIACDKVDSLQFADFTTAERLQFLNEAVLRFVKQRYSKNNIYQQGFEEIQKRTDDLKALVKTTTQSGVVVQNDIEGFNYKAYTFPNDYMFYLKSEILINYSIKENCLPVNKSIKKPIKIVQIDDLSKILNDPFNKPSKNKPKAVFINNTFNVYYDSENQLNYNLGDINFTYIKYPLVYTTLLSNNTEIELSLHTHKEIVQEAVLIAQSYINNNEGIQYTNNLKKEIE